MKKVEVVMKASALDTFVESATQLGVSDYNVSDVRLAPSFAVRERQRLYRGQEFALNLLARVKVEFAIADGNAKAVAEQLLRLTEPDTIRIYSLDHVITIPTTNAHDLPIARKDNGAIEAAGFTN